MSAKVLYLDYEPQPRQQILHQTKARFVLYGGSAGGGKSFCLRFDAVSYCLRNPGCQAYLFRRTLMELEANHIRFIRELPPEAGTWMEARKTFAFNNGSNLVCGYCENDQDVLRYQGSEQHYQGIDEAGTMTEYQLAFLRSRSRFGGWKPVETEYLPKIVYTANPGGVSHSYLKRTFIDSAPPETIFYEKSSIDPNDPSDKGWPSIFIPARMSDNKYLDADYRGAFGGLPDELAKALRDGDWDIASGSFFADVFKRDQHVVKPFSIPEHWLRFTAYDHGSAQPFANLWFAVASEDYTENECNIPMGALVVYRELYGAIENKDAGLKLPAEEIATRIRALETGEKITYRVADPSIWRTEGGGPSIGERMLNRGVNQRRAANSRIAGWDLVRRRLAGEDGAPMMFFFDSCVHLIRTLPVLIHDAHRIEDIAQAPKQPDHLADSLRYGVSSRPYTTALVVEEDYDPARLPTLREMIKPEMQTRQKRVRI